MVTTYELRFPYGKDWILFVNLLQAHLFSLRHAERTEKYRDSWLLFCVQAEACMGRYYRIVTGPAPWKFVVIRSRLEYILRATRPEPNPNIICATRMDPNASIIRAIWPDQKLNIVCVTRTDPKASIIRATWPDQKLNIVFIIRTDPKASIICATWPDKNWILFVLPGSRAR
jgi:hypothetical protein